MANAVQQLTIRLIDQLSGPAKGAAASLNALGQAGRNTREMRGMRTELTGLARDLQVLQQRAGALQNFRQMLSGFGQARQQFAQTRREVEETARALATARARLADLERIRPFGRGQVAQELRQQLQAARQEVSRLSVEYRTAQSNVRNASQALDQQKGALVALRTALEQAGVPTRTLSRAQRDLEAAIGRTTTALREQQQAANRAQLAQPARSGAAAPSAGGTQARGGSRVGVAVSASDLAVGAGAGYGLFRMYQTILNFEDEMNRAQQKGALTPEDRARIEAEARRIGTTFPFTQTQAAEMMRVYLAAGQTADQSIGMAQPTLEFALAGDMDPESAGLAIVAIANQYKMAMGTIQEAEASARKIGDIAQTIANNTQGQVEDVVAAFKYAAPFAEKLGIPIEQLGAYVATLIKGGLRGDEIGIALRSAMVRMVRPTNDSRAAMAEIGLSFEQFATERRDLRIDEFAVGMKQRGFNIDRILPTLAARIGERTLTDNAEEIGDILRESIIELLGVTKQVDQSKIASAVNSYISSSAVEYDMEALVMELTRRGVTPGQIARIFDQRQGSRIALMLGEEEQARYQGFLEQIHGSDGSISRAFDTRMQGLPGQDKLFRSAVENLVLTIGRAGLIEDATNMLNALTRGLIYMSEEHPNLLKTVTYAVAAAAALGMLAIPLAAIVRLMQGIGLIGAGAAAAGAAGAAGAGARAAGTRGLISRVIRHPATWAAAAAWWAISNQTDEAKNRANPWEVQRRRTRAVDPLSGAAGRDATFGAFGGFRPASRMPEAGQGFINAPLAFRRSAAAMALLPTARDPNTWSPSGGGSGVDIGVAPTLGGAGAFPLSRDYSAAGQTTFGSFADAARTEMTALESEVEAFVSRIQSRLSFTARPNIAPQISTEVRQAARAAYGDGGLP